MNKPERTPNYSSAFVIAVLIPAIQALLLALAITGAISIGFQIWFREYMIEGSAATFFLVFAVYSFVRFNQIEKLLWQVETLTGHDINRDGSIGEPDKFTVIENHMEGRSKDARH